MFHDLPLAHKLLSIRLELFISPKLVLRISLIFSRQTNDSYRFNRHNNAQPLGPHPFTMPEDDELRTLVATHISGFNISSSPGFDTSTPTFIKCACKRVPKHNERSWENVNVLVPHIAALFKLLIAKATIPRSWKEAKLTPIHKKGPVTQPGN